MVLRGSEQLLAMASDGHKGTAEKALGRVLGDRADPPKPDYSRDP